MKNAKLNNQTGMSLVSVITTMAILGAASLGVMQLVKMNEKGSQGIKNKGEALSLTSMVETRVKSMFLQTKSASGSLTNGMCSLVGVSTKDSQLTNVFINLPAKSKELLSPSIWNSAFSEFEEVKSGCSLSNAYGRCYRLKEDTLSKLGITDTTYKNIKPTFTIDIKPMYTNPVTADTFKELKANKSSRYDLKSIGFQYSIRSIYQRTADTQAKKGASEFLAGFIWAGDVGVCEVNNKKVSLTANSFGDPTSLVMFNLAGFSADSKTKTTVAPLSVTMLNTQIRSGILGGALGSQFLTSRDTASNENPNSGPAYSACNEYRYQCPQLNAGKRNYQNMRHLLRVGYQVPNIVQNTGSNIEFAPSVVFKDTNLKELNAKYSQSFTLGDFDYAEDKNGWYKTKIDNTMVPMRVGSEDMLTAVLSDSKYSSESNNVCRNICVPGTNFNTNTNNHYTSTFTYKVNVSDVKDAAKLRFEVASGPVACTACFMKNCDQFGLGTFGPMHEQPTEPLDANIPECFQHEDHFRNFYESNRIELGMSAANKCLSARLKQQDQSGFELEAVDCNRSQPVMCFAFGKHLLAREASLSGAQLTRKTFSESADTCFSLGREIIKKEPLRKLLIEQNNANSTAASFLGVSAESLQSPLPENDRVNFINLSAQGTFFAPVGLNQEARLREYASKTGEAANLLRSSFWVNLKTDSAGYIYAPSPKLAALAKNPENKWGIHYDGSGRLEVQESSSELGLSSGFEGKDDEDEAAKVALLFHSHRFKGVEFARSWQPFAKDEDLRVLCRKTFYPYEVFVSKDKTAKFKNAAKICRDERGLFLPPTTTSGWEKALLLVNENAIVHPFPTSKKADKNPVWVNLVQSGDEELISLGGFLSGGVDKFVSKGGEQFHQEEDLKDSKGREETYELACFNKEKGEISIQSHCQRGQRLLSEQEVMAAASSSNKILRSLLFIAFSNRDKHSVKKVRLY